MLMPEFLLNKEGLVRAARSPSLSPWCLREDYPASPMWQDPFVLK